MTPPPDIEILYHNDHLVAVHKPAGLLVHPAKIDKDSPYTALELMESRLACRLYPLHRLDKPTSGILLFAKSKEVSSCYGKLWQTHDVKKEYLALVRGWPTASGHIDHALKEEPAFKHEKALFAEKEAQSAQTDFVTLAVCELPFAVDKYPQSRYALVQASPVTGRRHQLRRHFKHISHPIIGDTTHGKSRHNRFFQSHFDCHRLLLANARLALPATEFCPGLTLECPPDASFSRVVDSIGSHWQWCTGTEADFWRRKWDVALLALSKTISQGD